MKVDQVRDSVKCRVDEVRYFVKIVDVVRVDQVRVDQVGCSHLHEVSCIWDSSMVAYSVADQLIESIQPVSC